MIKSDTLKHSGLFLKNNRPLKSVNIFPNIFDIDSVICEVKADYPDEPSEYFSDLYFSFLLEELFDCDLSFYSTPPLIYNNKELKPLNFLYREIINPDFTPSPTRNVEFFNFLSNLLNWKYVKEGAVSPKNYFYLIRDHFIHEKYQFFQYSGLSLYLGETVLKRWSHSQHAQIPL